MHRECARTKGNEILSGARSHTVRLTDGTEAKHLIEWPVTFAGRPPAASTISGRTAEYSGSNNLGVDSCHIAPSRSSAY